MSVLDIILGIIFAVGAISGFQKGFLISLFSLLAIFLGILGGFKLMGVAMVMLADHYSINENVLPYIAFGVVFIIISILVNILGNMLSGSLNKTVLGGVDQIAGGILGIVKTIFMTSVILWITESVSIDLPRHWKEDSWLYPFTANFAPQVTNWIGDIFPVFDDLFKSHT